MMSVSLSHTPGRSLARSAFVMGMVSICVIWRVVALGLSMTLNTSESSVGVRRRWDAGRAVSVCVVGELVVAWVILETLDVAVAAWDPVSACVGARWWLLNWMWLTGGGCS